MSLVEQKATVKEVVPLTNSVLQVVLQVPTYLPYEAGQYLEILIDKQWQAYSIANAPLGARHYELHIRHSGANPYDEPLFQQIKQQGSLRIRLPFGRCTLARLQDTQPILFIAVGTGFAPIKAMIEQLLATDDARRYDLWWAARSASDLYMDEKLQHWHTHVPPFSYHGFLANAQNQSLVSAICAHYKSVIQDFALVLAGPFDRVYSMRDRLLLQGVSRSAMIADAFDFEEKK